MLKVKREDFVPNAYRDYTYLEVPLPLPGEEATISCPHSYPLFYESLGVDRGDKFLEVGPKAEVVSVCNTDQRMEISLDSLLPEAFGPPNLSDVPEE